MKSAKILTILVLALGLMVSWPEVSKAVPMGTAFTYQGRLMDKNKPADGPYSFQFRLYDSNDPCTGTLLGSPIDINDLDVIDGHFEVELDFGSGIFDGNAVWLETRVVESPMGSDPATLSPLLELTPTPYALYAETAGSVKDGISWSEVSSRPAGLDDGDDVGITSETDPTVLALVKDGISWSEVSDRPAGLDDGDDVGGVPSGVIVMWSGAIGSIPSGWALCDGANGTPDLRTRFVLGAGGMVDGHNVQPDESNPISTSIKWDGSKIWYDSGSNEKEPGPGTCTGQHRDMMPPYYTLAFIMKLP